MLSSDCQFVGISVGWTVLLTVCLFYIDRVMLCSRSLSVVDLFICCWLLYFEKKNNNNNFVPGTVITVSGKRLYLASIFQVYFLFLLFFCSTCLLFLLFWYFVEKEIQRVREKLYSTHTLLTNIIMIIVVIIVAILLLV